MYIAIYLRISDEDGDLEQGKTESASITSQRKVILYFIRKNKELSQYPVKEFIDDGHSGVSFNRPGIQKLLKEVREGKVSCIIVKDLSRLGRNYIEVGDYIEQIFPFMGVRFISVADNYDSLKNTGGIETGFKNLIHDLYSRDLSKKIKSVKKMYQEKGAYSGGDVPFGYKKPERNQKNKVYIPDEAAAQIVREIFILASQGYSTSRISEYLNDKAIPTPGVYKNQIENDNYRFKNPKRTLWSAQQVREIIMNETYIGIFTCRKFTSTGPRKTKKNDESEFIKYENQHEPLVDKELFEAAGKAVISRGKRGKYKKNENPHPLKGKVKCGYCGYSTTINEKVSNPKFVCRMGNSCGAHTKIESQTLEKTVLEILQMQISVLKNEGNKRIKVVSTLNKAKEKKLQLEMKIERNKNYRMSLYRQYKEGKISKEEYFAKRDEVTKQQVKFENELELIIERLDHIAVQQTDDDLNKIIGAETVTKLTKELTDKLIDRIDVYHAGRVEITWKFQSEYSQIEKKEE